MKEGRSWIDTGLEISKKVDIAGIVIGMGMMAFGLVGTGILVAGTSAGTYILAREFQKRRQK